MGFLFLCLIIHGRGWERKIVRTIKRKNTTIYYSFFLFYEATIFLLKIFIYIMTNG